MLEVARTVSLNDVMPQEDIRERQRVQMDGTMAGTVGGMTPRSSGTPQDM